MTSCTKSTLPAHHQGLSLVPTTVTHSLPESSHTDLHSALTLPLSTNKTKISRATLRLGGGISLTDNTGNWRRIVAVWWWWLCCWTLLQWTLISSAPHIVGEYGGIATSKEWSSQRNRPCMVDLKISYVLHQKQWFNHTCTYTGTVWSKLNWQIWEPIRHLMAHIHSVQIITHTQKDIPVVYIWLVHRWSSIHCSHKLLPTLHLCTPPPSPPSHCLHQQVWHYQ